MRLSEDKRLKIDYRRDHGSSLRQPQVEIQESNLYLRNDFKITNQQISMASNF
jgi:hypothetical protein